MTITRLKQTGLETGSLSEFDTATGNAILATPQAKTGLYGLRISPYSPPAAAGFSFTNTYQSRVGFFVYPAYNVGNPIELFRFKSAGYTDLLDLQYLVDLRRISLYVNDELKHTGDVDSLSVNTWTHIGIDFKVDGAAGWAKVYKNGIEILSFAGNTGTTQISQAIWGNTKDAGAGVGYVYFDDMYVDDTTGEGAAAVCPLYSFYPLTLDGNGNYAQWDGSDGNSTDNYLLVDEIPPSESDYVETNVADELDSYTMTGITLGAGQTIAAVIPTVYAKRAGGTEQIAVGTRLSSTDLIGSDQDLGMSIICMNERQTTKPGGGDWGESDVNGAELVIKSRGSY